MNRVSLSFLVVLMLAYGCVVPVRRTLPAVDGTLVNGIAAVPGARVGYTWDFDPVDCDSSSIATVTDADGHFEFVQERWWAVGVISPVPDIGRNGWQLCFESADGRARYFRILAEPQSVSVACDLARTDSERLCEVTWR